MWGSWNIFYIKKNQKINQEKERDKNKWDEEKAIEWWKDIKTTKRQRNQESSTKIKK